MMMALKHNARPIGWIFLAMLMLAGCGDDANTQSGTGDDDANNAANNDENNTNNNDTNNDQNNDGGDACEPSPEPIFLAFGGSVLDPDLTIAANNERALVVWQEFGNDDLGSLVDGPVRALTLEADQTQTPQAQIIFDPAQQEGEVNGSVLLTSQGEDFVAVWNHKTGPGDFDIEVRGIGFDSKGEPGDTQTLDPGPAARFGVTPGERPDGTALITTWPPPDENADEFDFRIWGGLDDTPTSAKVAFDPQSSIRFSSVRLIGLADGGLAAIYEKDDDPNAYWENLDADDVRITGQGKVITDGGIALRARAGQGRTAFFGESRREDTNGETLSTQIRVVLVDDEGNTITDTLLAEDNDPFNSGLTEGELLFDGDELIVLWTRRFIDAQTAFERAEIYSARMNPTTGALITPAALLMELDDHDELSEAPGGFSPRTQFALSAGRVAMVYSTGVFEAFDNDSRFEFDGLNYHFMWICVP